MCEKYCGDLGVDIYVGVKVMQRCVGGFVGGDCGVEFEF